MSTVLNYSATSILELLDRFEKQVSKTKFRNDLIKLFCMQIIPFLADHPLLETLRARWLARRQELAYSSAQNELKTINEVKSTFAKIRQDLQDCSDKNIQSQITTIDSTLKGKNKCYNPPTYVIVIEELNKLLELVFKAGYIDICKRYSNLQIHQKFIKKDPNQRQRWGLLNEQGQIYKILSCEELTKAHGDPNLISIPPEMLSINETIIEPFIFAPTLEKTYESKRARQSDQTNDPAVVWEWMESALYYWNTPASNFDEISLPPKTQSDGAKYFRRRCESAAWCEIENAKQNQQLRSRPSIFTDRFFRLGIRTLINDIRAFLSLPSLSTETGDTSASVCTFELLLDGYELWISTRLNNEKEKFYLQKFNDDKKHPDGSLQLRFVKKLIEQPGGGEVVIELQDDPEHVGKFIHRLKLPKTLKNFFFNSSHGSFVYFNGTKIELKQNNQINIDTILRELRENHYKFMAKRNQKH